MQKLIFTLIVGLTATVFATGSYLIYLQNENINLYAKQLLGTRQDYRKLELEYQKLKEKERQTVIIANGNTEKNTAISNLINNYTQKVNGDISVYYKNLATDESVRVNADKKYYMASLYKIILVLYVLDQIETGTTSLSDRVGTSSATLDVAIDKIITESNNEYAQTLANQYGWKNIEQAMKEKLGIEFSFKGDLQTSAKNIGRLFEKIAYSLNIADWQSEYLLSLMNNQKKTSKLPKYLPSNIYSHNKTGEFEDYSHDAGIFYTPRGNYILVFMSKSKNPGITDELMAKMSKDIFASLNPQTNTSQ